MMPTIGLMTIVFAALTIYLCHDEYKNGKMSSKNFKIVAICEGFAILGMIIAAMQNPATAWVTPPGRMIVSILENGLLIPTVLFLVLFIYGLYILLTEKND